MSERFQWKNFRDIDLEDKFFDSLKKDYPEFSDWFQGKIDSDKNALVFNDEQGVGAFLYLKRENESIELINKTLPRINRLKIGTLRLAERIRGNRLGEGALGVALWYWRETKYDEIYVTVFAKHTELVNLFLRFGFINVGENVRGECILIKNRKMLNCENPYTCFPFLPTSFEKCGLLPINDNFHDKLFPYSEISGSKKEIVEKTAGNGVTKVFIAAPYTSLHYTVGMPVAIYRIHTGENQKTYKSAITSYCTITSVERIKENNRVIVSFDDFVKRTGNKTIFSYAELKALYEKKNNLIILELIYNGYFGKGRNVIHKKLKEKGLFEGHPYTISYTKNQLIQILEMGDVDVQNTFVD